MGYIASASQKTVGVHRSPQEFIEAALEAKHPGFLSDQLPDPMVEAVEFCTRHSDDFVATSRSETLRAMMNEAQNLAKQEMELKAGMSDRRRNILSKKRLLLFEALLRRAGSPDLKLVDDIGSGFDLTGKLPTSNQFGTKFRPASIPPEALRGVADRARKALLESVRSSGDAK